MSAYLCIGIDTKAKPPQVIGYRIFSAKAEDITRTGNGIEWATVYAFVAPLYSFDESRKECEHIAREQFPWLKPAPFGWPKTKYICPKCGSHDIEAELPCWVNPNTLAITDLDADADFMEFYCNGCETHFDHLDETENQGEKA